MNPHVFCWQHIVYFIISMCATVGALTLIKLKVKSEKTLNILIKSFGGVMLILMILSRISVVLDNDKGIMFLPESLCGVTNIVLAVCAIFCKKDALPFHFAVYAAFFGGIANTIYPYYLSDYPTFWHFSIIIALLHHSFALFLTVLLTITGFFKPSLRKFYALPVGLCIVLCYGILLIDAFKFETAINIFEALVPGTILTWYAVFPAMVLATLAGVVIYERVLKLRDKKSENVQQSANANHNKNAA